MLTCFRPLSGCMSQLCFCFSTHTDRQTDRQTALLSPGEQSHNGKRSSFWSRSTSVFDCCYEVVLLNEYWTHTMVICINFLYSIIPQNLCCLLCFKLFQVKKIRNKKFVFHKPFVNWESSMWFYQVAYFFQLFEEVTCTANSHLLLLNRVLLFSSTSASVIRWDMKLFGLYFSAVWVLCCAVYGRGQ